MGDDSGSELSELESSRMEAEGEEDWEGKDRSRPNFARAAVGAGQQLSSQEFFCHGAKLSGGDNIFSTPREMPSRDGDNIFATPGKQAMRGALARSLSAAASSSPQQLRPRVLPRSSERAREWRAARSREWRKARRRGEWMWRPMIGRRRWPIRARTRWRAWRARIDVLEYMDR